MASDMDLSPQNNGNTQLLVENRNVQTPGEFIVVKQAIF
jgi:hypothetical protein